MTIEEIATVVGIVETCDDLSGEIQEIAESNMKALEALLVSELPAGKRLVQIHSNECHID